MAFVDKKYQGDDDEVYLVRMSDALATAFAANTEPAGAVTRPFHVQNSGSRRQFGLLPRSVVATRKFGSGVDAGTKSIRVPILDPAKLEGETPAIAVGTKFMYQSKEWTISAVLPEDGN